jgi:transposase-like protein
MTDYPLTQAQLEELFQSEAACIDYICAVRWPEGLRCEKCQHTEFWRDGSVFTCKLCRHRLRVMAGIIFQNTKIPLSKWFRTMWEVVRRKNGASALAIASGLKINYDTAWNLLQKLRRAMVHPGRKRLSGFVEVDETYYGGFSEGQPGRTKDARVLIAGAIELKVEDDKTRIGRARLQIIDSASAANLLGFIRDNVEEGSHVNTDGWSSYSQLGAIGYRHHVDDASIK